MPDNFNFQVPELNDLYHAPTGPTAPAPRAPAAPATPAGPAPVPYLKAEDSDPFAQNFLQQNEQQVKALGLSTGLGTAGRTQYYNADQVDPFTAQKNYQGAGFDPGDTQGNNDRYAARETMGSTLDKSLGDFSYKFAGSFKGNFNTYVQMGKSLWNMDMSKMDLDEDEKVKQYYADNQNELKNKIFQTAEDDDHFFNKQFVKDLLGNSGFALGTFAAMGLELAADTVLEGITFGGATPVVAADAAGLGARLLGGMRKLGEGFQMAAHTPEEIARGARMVREMESGLKTASELGLKGTTITEAGVRDMKAIWAQARIDLSSESKAQGFYQKAGDIFKHVPVLGELPQYGARMVAAGQAGESALKVAGIGLAGLRRSVVELNMAASEAAFESVTTYGDTLDRLVQQHRSENDGEAPSAEQLSTMRQYASNASGNNYASNLALLLASNKMQFGNMLSKFKPANKYMRDVLEEGAEHYVKVAGRIAEGAEKTGADQVGKLGTRLYEKGFTGTYGQLGRIATDFGKKEALWQGVKTFGKDVTRFEFAEGIQENLQETTAAGWRDYYVNAYSGKPQTLARAMGEGLQEQFTQTGLKTFLMGALTGAIIHGPTKVAEGAIAQFQAQNYKWSGGNDPVKSAKEQTGRDIEAVNTMFRDPGRYVFNPQQLLFNEQVQAATQMTEAARSGQVYEWKDAKENSLLSIAKAARRLNALGALTGELGHLGQQLTPEAFKDAFGMDLSETRYKTVSEFTDHLSKDLTSYVDEISAVKRKLGPLTDPMRFGLGTSAYYGVAELNNSLEGAIETVALNKIKGGLAAKRANDVAQNLSKIQGLGEMSDWLISSLTRFNQHEAERGHLAQRTAQLKTALQEQEKSQADQGNAGITYDPVLHEKLKKELAEQEELTGLMDTWNSYFEHAAAPVVTDPRDAVDERGAFVSERTRFVGKKGELNHPDVMDTFTQLANAKAKSAAPFARPGQQLSYDSVSQGFDHLVDYIRLDKDVRDYLEAVDKISSPANFVAHWSRMRDGQFKAGMAYYLETQELTMPEHVAEVLFHVDLREVMEAEQGKLPSAAVEALSQADYDRCVDILYERDAQVNELTAWLRDTSQYKAIQVLYLSEKLGIEQGQYFTELTQQLAKSIPEQLAKVLGLPDASVTAPVAPAVAPAVAPVAAAAPAVAPTPPGTPTPTPTPSPAPSPAPGPADPNAAPAIPGAPRNPADRPFHQMLVTRIALLIHQTNLLRNSDMQTAQAANNEKQGIEAQDPDLLNDYDTDEQGNFTTKELDRIENQLDGLPDADQAPWVAQQLLENRAEEARLNAAHQAANAPVVQPAPTPTPVVAGPVVAGPAAGATPGTPAHAAQQAAAGFGAAALSVSGDALKAAAERVDKDGSFVVTKPAAVAMFLADPNYNVVQNPDGTLTVIGVKDEDNDWHGVRRSSNFGQAVPSMAELNTPPPAATVLVTNPVTATVELRDAQGTVIASAPEAGAAAALAPIKAEIDHVTADRDFLTTLLKGDATHVAELYKQAAALLKAKNERSATSTARNPTPQFASIEEFYNYKKKGGGKADIGGLITSLTTPAAAPLVVAPTAPDITVNASMIASQGPSRFTNQAAGIQLPSAAEFKGFTSRLDEIWARKETTSTETSTKSGIFEESTESTSPVVAAPTVTQEDVLSSLREALACLV